MTSTLGLFLLLSFSTPYSDVCRQANEAAAGKDPAAAEALLKQCVKTASAPLTSFIQLCSLYQSQKREEELFQAALTGLTRFPGEKRFYLTVGLHYARSKEYPPAIKVFSEGTRRWPGDPKLGEYLGGAYLELGLSQLDAGNDAVAVDLLRKAVRLEPGDAQAHLNLGRALHNLRRSPEAVAEFDRVIQLKPDLPLAHFHRGMVLCSLGEFRRSIADLDREIQINPQYPPSYHFRGEARMGLDDFPGALPDLETAAARMPDSFKVYFSLGRCLSSLRRIAEAEAAYRKAIELNPSDVRTVMALARLLQNAGRSEESAPLFKRAAELMNEQRPLSAGPEPKPPLR